jgi:hypothetical protein
VAPQRAHVAFHLQHGLLVLRREVSDAEEMAEQRTSDHSAARLQRKHKQLEKRNQPPAMRTPRTGVA